jgi:hypothetical protein
MDRIDYIALLDRALVSVHGIRLDYADDMTARRVRAKLYHIRDEIRAEARTPATSPAVTYDVNGKLLGVIDIVRRRAPPSTPYDALRMRVWDGSLYIVAVTEQPRRVDELELPEVQDVAFDELVLLPHWPPWSA